MRSATLIYSPHLNEISPQKNGLTGPSYTTANFSPYFTALQVINNLEP